MIACFIVLSFAWIDDKNKKNCGELINFTKQILFCASICNLNSSLSQVTCFHPIFGFNLQLLFVTFTSNEFCLKISNELKKNSHQIGKVVSSAKINQLKQNKYKTVKSNRVYLIFLVVAGHYHGKFLFLFGKTRESNQTLK